MFILTISMKKGIVYKKKKEKNGTYIYSGLSGRSKKVLSK